MIREILYQADDDDDDDDDIFEDLEDLRRACMVSSDPNSASGGELPSTDSDFEILGNIKSQLASTDVDSCLPVPSDSDSEEDDFEMLRNIKSQLGTLPMDEDEALGAIRRRFSAYQNLMNDDSPKKKKTKTQCQIPRN